MWGISTIPETEYVLRMDGTRRVFKNLSQPIKDLVFFSFSFHFDFCSFLPGDFIPESLLNDHHTMSATEKFCKVNS